MSTRLGVVASVFVIQHDSGRALDVAEVGGGDNFIFADEATLID